MLKKFISQNAKQYFCKLSPAVAEFFLLCGAWPDAVSFFFPIYSNSRPSHWSLYSVISSIPEGIFVPLSALSTRHLTPPFPATASPRDRHLY